ncbi:MAG: serine threonine kinase [Lasallia pustulata]|uniref:Serine threonine kinase n=1 Tax=Lasallia pustulata TaxID=136370 RepID=A0A5M8PV79_9LECA|nr:MAG: serine threonine kinase [Lasallia pustulata]
MSRVYLATAGKQTFVLKEVPQSEFNYYLDIYRGLPSCAYLRQLQDTIPEQLMFVFQYFTDHLLSLAQMDLPIALTKRILKDTLRGLAVLHDQNIVHNDLKANNIVINWEKEHHEIKITQVQLTDFEDSARVPPGYNILDKQVGNWMWRSPEAHAQGPVNKPSDMFSFGVVCIYAVHKRVIFAIGEHELEEGLEPLAIVLERQISYFADEDGLDMLFNHLGDTPWCQVLKILKSGFNKTNPRRPFSLWKNVDADFKDLIGGLTNFDPAKRLTAHEALAHRWFGDVSADD